MAVVGDSMRCAVSVLVVVLNAVEIVFLVRLRHKHKNYTTLLLSLSVSDAIFGLVNIALLTLGFLTAYWQTARDIMLETWEIAFTLFLFTVLTLILHLVCITLDRLWAIGRPFSHKTRVTRVRMRIASLAYWVVIFLLSAGVLAYEMCHEEEDTTGDKLEEYRRTYELYANRALSCVILAADVVFIISYTAIVGYMQPKSSVHKSAMMRRKEQATCVFCILIAAVFVVCTMPYAVYNFAQNSVPYWANLMLLVNSALNPVVYFFRSCLTKTFVRVRTISTSSQRIDRKRSESLNRYH